MSCTIKDGKYFAPNGEESILYKSLRENVNEEEAHSLFIKSKTPTFKTDVEIPLLQTYKNKVAKIPENINFKETFENKIRTFHIYNGKAKVGRIQLTAYKDGFKVKSALVSEKQRGKGFGKYLYNYAVSRLLAENNTLYTDTARTEDADKVWESLKRQGLSQDGKSVKSLPKEFDKNGEVLAPILLEYVENNFTETTPLTAVEKSHLINVNIPNVETSDDLYRTLYEAFYKNNLFSPNLNKLKKIYSEEEIRNILEDGEIQGRVKDTIERLRHTEEFTIPQIKYNKDFDYRSAKVNIIGQFKKENPLKLEKQFKEQEYTKVPVIDESGKQLETQLFYENAIKEPSKKAERAIKAIVSAHPMVDITDIENSVIREFKNYGMDIEGLERENFKELLAYVDNPSQETRIPLEDALGFVRQPLEKAVNIPPSNRNYQYLKTAKSEQELFDEMSLIQTTTPNVYHKINKIDEQEMRDIQENQDLTIPVFELYKEYYGYGLSAETQKIKEQSIADGTFMKAPNGKPTNLSEDNWLFVRTAAFKNWFGDFENSPETSSKVVDENGEPLVVWHYTREDFSEFDINKARKSGYSNVGFWFGSNSKISSQYGTKAVSSFLTIRDEKLHDSWDDFTRDVEYVARKSELGDEANYYRKALREDYDGVVLESVNIDEKIGAQDIFIAFNPNQIKSAETKKLQINQDSNDIRYFKRPSNVKPILASTQTDIEYLTNGFIADFAAEKIKNPTEFNKQFKVTQNGLELVSDDIITLETIKAYIKDNAKYAKEIADYSLISKDMPNLKYGEIDKRAEAVNNPNSVSKPTTEVTILDEESIYAPNETAPFIRINNDVYEQQEAGYYNKLEKSDNAIYFTFPKTPEFKNFDLKQEQTAETKTKKLIDKETDSDNFGCIS